MKIPEDTHIPQSQIQYADSPLPLNAVLYGFTVDRDAEQKNEEIMQRLKQLYDKHDWQEIVLEGKQTNDHLAASNCVEHFESPFASFVDSFGQLLTLLDHKIERMRQFEAMLIDQQGVNCLDWLVYRESVVVQVAGMCVESNRNNTKNYTIQAFLHRQGVEEVDTTLNQLLEHHLCVDGNREAVTTRTALKIVRDKFICHFDNIEPYDLHGNVRSDSWSRGDMLVIMNLLLPAASNRECIVVRLIRAMNCIYEKVLQEKRYEYLFKNLRTSGKEGMHNAFS